MFKTLLTVSGSIILCATLAQAAEVKITSFNFIAYRSSAAELCGSITGDIGSIAIIDVTADPTYKTPAQYSTMASKDGKFCIVINTLTGKADAKLRGGTNVASAKIN